MKGRLNCPDLAFEKMYDLFDRIIKFYIEMDIDIVEKNQIISTLKFYMKRLGHYLKKEMEKQ